MGGKASRADILGGSHHGTFKAQARGQRTQGARDTREMAVTVTVPNTEAGCCLEVALSPAPLYPGLQPSLPLGQT